MKNKEVKSVPRKQVKYIKLPVKYIKFKNVSIDNTKYINECFKD